MLPMMYPGLPGGSTGGGQMTGCAFWFLVVFALLAACVLTWLIFYAVNCASDLLGF